MTTPAKAIREALRIRGPEALERGRGIPAPNNPMTEDELHYVVEFISDDLRSKLNATLEEQIAAKLEGMNFDAMKDTDALTVHADLVFYAGTVRAARKLRRLTEPKA